MDQWHRDRGFKHLVHAFGWSMAGLSAAVRHETAFRQELAASALLIPLALWLGESGVERACLSASVMMVLIAELVNSAIEAAVDRVGLDEHPLSKRAKDLGSAAVFVAITTVVLVWTAILYPQFVT